ncbi:MAG TPA: hypothetical protein PL045_00300 [Chitinophagaceae bacterium]|nr:hypothetical protein [Chitinophagaceae bacterium]
MKLISIFIVALLSFHCTTNGDRAENQKDSSQYINQSGAGTMIPQTDTLTAEDSMTHDMDGPHKK